MLHAIGKRVYHSLVLMRRQYSDGAGAADGHAKPRSGAQPVNRYDPRVTMMHEMVNESTTHRFSCAGNIPTELGRLTTMQHMDLRYNQLTGNIPAELGRLTAMRELYLDENQLTGPIPSQIGQLGQLALLYLGDNQLTGECRETHFIAIGKRVYHSPVLMCRPHSDGAGAADGNGRNDPFSEQVKRYDPRITMLYEMVNESTSDSFVTEMRWQVPFPPKLGSWGS